MINILKEIENIKLHKSLKDGIALKKPLFLLNLIAKIQNENIEENKFFFTEIEKPLDKLIRSFDARSTIRGGKPNYPFQYLNSSTLWDLHLCNDLKTINSNPLPIKILRDPQTYGTLHPDLFFLLKTNSSERIKITKFILDRFWPETVQEDLINYLMLDIDVIKKRNHLYANKVLSNYRYKCAMCGFTGLFNESPFGLDAAHIKWHAYGGPDETENGIALCKLHHWAFDRGAITILDNSLKIVVSSRFTAQDQISMNLLEDINGKFINSYKIEAPNEEFLRWHNDNIFIS